MIKFIFVTFIFIFSTYSECMDLRYEYISELVKKETTVASLKKIEKYKEVASNPAMIFNRFYDIFLASATKHPMICVYAMYSVLAYVTFSGNTDGNNINRICDLREKLEVLVREGKCANDLEEVVIARNLADSVTSHIPYAGMTLCTYGGVKADIPPNIKKCVYGKISERSVVNAKKNALFNGFHKFIVENPL